MAELFVRALTDPILVSGIALTARLFASGPGRWTAFGTGGLGNKVRLPAGERVAGTWRVRRTRSPLLPWGVTGGTMAVQMLGLRRGPEVTTGVALYQ